MRFFLINLIVEMLKIVINETTQF